MRVRIALLALLLSVPALFGQTRRAPKPDPAAGAGDEAAPAAQKPTVFWTHSMKGKPGPAVPLPADVPSGQPKPAKPPSDAAEPDQPVSARPPAPTPVVPLLPVVTPPPTAEDSRAAMLTGLATLAPGASRAEMVAKLGKPIYSIAMSEDGHYRERCRYRAGTQPVAVIDLVDGTIHRIDTATP